MTKTDEILIEVMRCLFIALGQAMGPKALVNASVYLAELARKQNGEVKKVLLQILRGVDQ